MEPKNRELKDYCHTGGAPGHYEAGVMFFRDHDGAIRRCVVQVDELHALVGSDNAKAPVALEQIYEDFRLKIEAAADDQLLHGDGRETVIIQKLFLDLPPLPRS